MFAIGTVPYLNAQPLHRSLQDRPDVKVVGAVPARLAPQLQRCEHDVALIPVVEHFRGVGRQIVSDACIGSSHQVHSVLIFHRCPVDKIAGLALDTNSRTSVALAQIVLADSFGVQPQRGAPGPNLAATMQQYDAALLIGDPAIEARAHAAQLGAGILDLGQAWTALTGLPFVYAAWVTRRGLAAGVVAELAQLLAAARDEGVGQIDAIARDNPTGLSVGPAAIKSYLTHNIEFWLTDRHRLGLEEFQKRCRAHGLAPATVDS
jgi:chorismate dehydratase